MVHYYIKHSFERTVKRIGRWRESARGQGDAILSGIARRRGGQAGRKGRGSLVFGICLLISAAVSLGRASGPGPSKASSDPKSASNSGLVEVRIETDGTRFRVVSVKPVERAGRVFHRQALGNGRFLLEFLDAAGKVLHVRSVPDPSLVYVDRLSAAAGEGKEKRGNGSKGALESRRKRLDRAQSAVILPADSGIRAVRISLQRSVPMKDRAPERTLVPMIPMEGPFTLPDGIELLPRALLKLRVGGNER